jgi:hypothetical protein
VRSLIKVSAAIAISIALATALGACSLLPILAPAPTPTPTGESISAACDALESEVEEVKSEMLQAAEVLNTKTGAAAEILSLAAFRLNFMAEEEIQNEEVVDLTTKVSESITVLSDLLTEAAADPANADVEAIDAAGDDVNAAFDAFEKVCPGPAESVSAACDTLATTATSVNAELSVASDLISTDPTTGAGMVAEAAGRLEEAAAAVDNEKISELATATSDSLTLFSGLINALAADPDHPDEAALSAGSNDLNAAFGELASTCEW